MFTTGFVDSKLHRVFCLTHTSSNHIVFISLFVNMLFMLRLFALFGRARWSTSGSLCGWYQC
jgi:hypothetical protein